MTLRWSLFNKAQDNKPKGYEGTWEDLAPLFERAHRSTCPSGTPDEQKKGMPAFCGAAFHEGANRGIDGVNAIHVMCFDFDNARPEATGEYYDQQKRRPKLKKVKSDRVATPEEVVSRMKDYTFRAYTTWSHTEEWPKFRVVVPLETPVPPAQYVALGEWLIAQLGLSEFRDGGSIDLPVLRDPARMNFLPGSPLGETKFWRNEAKFVRPTEDLASVEIPEIPAPAWMSQSHKPDPERDSGWVKYGIVIAELDAAALLQAVGCRVGAERTYRQGCTKRRLTCPYGHEHSHGPEGDDAVLICEPGKWPSFSCSHSGHINLGILDVLDSAMAAGINLLDYAPALQTEFTLGENSTDEEIEKAIQSVRFLPALQRERAMDKIAKQTKISKKLILKMAKPAQKSGPDDEADALLQQTLSEYYAGGEHLLQTSTKMWMVYNSIYWAKMSNPAVVRGHLVQVARERGCAGAMSAIVGQAMQLAEATLAKRDDVFHAAGKDADIPRVVNCRNGELWISDSGEWDFRPHRAQSYLPYALSVDYRSDASCPMFDQALLDIFEGDEDMVRHIWEFFGYVIQPHRTYRTWWLWHGRGANGKTSLAKTLQRLLNPDSVLPLRMDTFGQSQFDLGNLRGKLLAIDDDMAANTKLPEGLLKQLSEDKMLSGRDLFESNAQFVSRVVPLMLTNNIPHLSDLTDGTKKRAKIIHFPHQFDERLPNPFPTIWANEMPGILLKSLEGFKRLRSRGSFLEPESAQDAFGEFLQRANPTARFVLKICVREDNYTIPLSKLYDSYKAWTDHEGFKNVVARSWFRNALEDQGVKVTETPSASFYDTQVVHGLRPKEQSGKGQAY